MMAAALQELVDKGLMQPRKEPTFFSYPSGYDLIAPTTGYNTVVVGESITAMKDQYAKLESGPRRA